MWPEGKNLPSERNFHVLKKPITSFNKQRRGSYIDILNPKGVAAAYILLARFKTKAELENTTGIIYDKCNSDIVKYLLGLFLDRLMKVVAAVHVEKRKRISQEKFYSTFSLIQIFKPKDKASEEENISIKSLDLNKEDEDFFNKMVGKGNRKRKKNKNKKIKHDSKNEIGMFFDSCEKLVDLMFGVSKVINSIKESRFNIDNVTTESAMLANNFNLFLGASKGKKHSISELILNIEKEMKDIKFKFVQNRAMYYDKFSNQDDILVLDRIQTNLDNFSKQFKEQYLVKDIKKLKKKAFVNQLTPDYERKNMLYLTKSDIKNHVSAIDNINKLISLNAPPKKSNAIEIEGNEKDVCDNSVVVSETKFDKKILEVYKGSKETGVLSELNRNKDFIFDFLKNSNSKNKILCIIPKDIKIRNLEKKIANLEKIDDSIIKSLTSLENCSSKLGIPNVKQYETAKFQISLFNNVLETKQVDEKKIFKDINKFKKKKNKDKKNKKKMIKEIE